MIGYKIRAVARVVTVMVLVGLQLPAHAAAAARSAKATGPAVAIPTVEGPVTGGKGAAANAAGFDLAAVGYEQAECFISGNATAYTSPQPLSSDGRWTVTAASAMATPPATPVLGCAPAINAGHQGYVVRAAVHALDAWVRDGTAPPRAPRLEMDATGGAFVVDEHGNVRGGIRTPAVDAPVATLSGIAVTGGGLCRLFGATTPFDGPTLLSLYPTHAAFVKAWDKAVAASVKAGFVLAADSGGLERAAAQSTISSGA